MSTPKTTVRLIHYRTDGSCMFYLVLEEPLTKIIGAWSAKEGDGRPREIPPPPLVLADSLLPDGDWGAAPAVEIKAAQPSWRVATMASEGCSSLSIEATDHGTFDLSGSSFTVLRSGLC